MEYRIIVDDSNRLEKPRSPWSARWDIEGTLPSIGEDPTEAVSALLKEVELRTHYYCSGPDGDANTWSVYAEEEAQWGEGAEMVDQSKRWIATTTDESTARRIAWVLGDPDR